MNYNSEVPSYAFTSPHPGCDCYGYCVDASVCACLQLSQGPNYSQSERTLLQLQVPQGRFQRPVFECSSQCACKLGTCRNRLVQYFKDDTSALHLFTAGEKGLGVRATRDIRQGEFVCAFSGYHTSQMTAKIISDAQYSIWNHVYVMIVREFIGENIHPVFESAVDGACEAIDNCAPHPLTRWPPSAFINHSCQPNMTVIPVRIESSKAYLTLFAIRDIREGEELTYDYTERSREVGGQTDRNCLCGSSSCRGFLPNCI
uniref:SET domain-containing protein n=1 Tax=Mesocestoides corti TaxID=53468 RepID=A0A5K3F1V1_MESCO